MADESQGMTRRELATVLCRLLALYFAYVAVAGMLEAQSVAYENPEAAVSAAPFTLAAALAVAFWFGARMLGRLMIREGALPSWPAELTSRVLLTIGVILLGLAWMVQGTLELVTWATLNLTRIYAGEHHVNYATAYVGDQQRGLFGSLLLFLAGVLLVFGGRGVVRLLGKIRDGAVWMRGGVVDEEVR